MDDATRFLILTPALEALREVCYLISAGFSELTPWENRTQLLRNGRRYLDTHSDFVASLRFLQARLLDPQLSWITADFAEVAEAIDVVLTSDNENDFDDAIETIGFLTRDFDDWLSDTRYEYFGDWAREFLDELVRIATASELQQFVNKISSDASIDAVKEVTIDCRSFSICIDGTRCSLGNTKEFWLLWLLGTQLGKNVAHLTICDRLETDQQPKVIKSRLLKHLRSNDLSQIARAIRTEKGFYRLDWPRSRLRLIGEDL